jgi:hypothetical protein
MPVVGDDRAKVTVGGAEDAARGQLLQGFKVSLGLRTAGLRGDDVMHATPLQVQWCSATLHPENATEVFIDGFRPLALAASREEAAAVGSDTAAKHQLILAASTEWTCFSAELSPDGPYLAHLLVHASLPDGVSNPNVQRCEVR